METEHNTSVSQSPTDVGESNFEKIVFFGRNLAEYEAMFSFSSADLVGLRVLDCPGGPACFQALSKEKGIHTVSVDTMYSHSVEQLAAIAQADIDETIRKIQITPEKYQVANIEEYREKRESAMRIFLLDFANGGPLQYVAASLPILPFADDSFDVCLCGFLPFFYSSVESGGCGEGTAALSLEWHRASLRELLRVTRSEVKVYPAINYHTGAVHAYASTLAAEFNDELERGTTENSVDVSGKVFARASFYTSQYPQKFAESNFGLLLKKVTP